MKPSPLSPMSERRAAEIASGARRHAPGSTFAARTEPMKKGGRIRPKPRSAEEFARIYRSPEFVFYVHMLLLCPVCGAEGPQVAHMTNGGMGRKADVEESTILCGDCHTVGPRAQHRIGWPAFRREHARVDFELVGQRALEAFESPEIQAWVDLKKSDGTFARWLDRRAA